MPPGAKVVHFDDGDTDEFVIHDNKYASKRKRNEHATQNPPAEQPNDRPQSKRPKPHTQKQERDLQKRKLELLDFRKGLPVYSGKSLIHTCRRIEAVALTGVWQLEIISLKEYGTMTRW